MRGIFESFDRGSGGAKATEGRSAGVRVTSLSGQNTGRISADRSAWFAHSGGASRLSVGAVRDAAAICGSAPAANNPDQRRVDSQIASRDPVLIALLSRS